VAEAIDLARALGCLPPRLCVLGLCVADAAQMTTDVDLQSLSGAVMELIADWLAAA